MIVDNKIMMLVLQCPRDKTAYNGHPCGDSTKVSRLFSCFFTGNDYPGRRITCERPTHFIQAQKIDLEFILIGSFL